MTVLKPISLIVCVLFSISGFCQENKYTKRNKTAPVIQYSVDKCYSRCILVKDSLVFTSNSNGSLYVTDLQTKTSKNLLVGKKYEELRDLFLVNGELIAVQSGSKGLFIRTNGMYFKGEYEAPNKQWEGLFINSVDVLDSIGFMMGDPVDGEFSLYFSTDKGRSWKKCVTKVSAREGEAGFAASGSTVQVVNDSTFVFVTGGKKSQFLRTNDRGHSWASTSLPYLPSESSGAFSICMINNMEGVIVGGDYKNPDLCMNTCFFTDDGGKFWINAKTQTRGYRSCVIFKNDVFYACGSNGIDYSTDKGENWKPFADGTFMALCADDKRLYATMPNGSFQLFELVNKTK